MDENLNIGLETVGKLITDKLKVVAKDDGFYSSGKLDNAFRYEAAANNLAIFSAKYARALSDGVTKDKSYSKVGEDFKNSILKWAKIKGMRPNTRNSKGQFSKVKDYHWNSMAIALAIGIRRNGISKRFGYKGSGFFDTMQDQLKEQIRTILSDSYKMDLKTQIRKDGINTN